MTPPPDRRRLTRAWVLLVLLTLGSLLASQVGAPQLPDGWRLAGTGLVLVVMVFKGRRVLLDFLNLQAASRGWRAVFSLWLGLLAGSIWLAAATPTLLAT